MSNYVIILATQRSGTNLFRKSLSSSSFFHDGHEIFLNVKHRESFWTHRAKLVTKNLDLLYPSKENQSYIFDSFLEELSTLHTQKIILIDIKYNSAHNLNTAWQDSERAPFLFNILAERKIPVIHLIRKNIFDTYLSSLVAKNLQTWIVRKGDVPENPKIEIQIDRMIQELERRRREINLYKQWLLSSKSPKSIEISYESLLDNSGNFSDRVTERVCEFLKIDKKLDLKIKTKKISKSASEIVTNYQTEVVPALIKHDFGDLLDKK